MKQGKETDRKSKKEDIDNGIGKQQPPKWGVHFIKKPQTYTSQMKCNNRV